MMQTWLRIFWFILVFDPCLAQDVSPYLEAQVATHQYHGDGAEINDGAGQESVASTQREHLSSSDWLNKHLPEIFSQDHINFAMHDQMVANHFNDVGLTDYEAWQKKQLAVLIRHQSIVKASVVKPVDESLNQTSSETQSFAVPVKLVFHGYDRHFAKKIDVVNLVVDVGLKPDPINDWVISKLSVTVNDNRTENQIPA